MGPASTRNSNRWVSRRFAKLSFLSAVLFIILPGSAIDTEAAFSLNWLRDYSAEGASFTSNDAYIVCKMSYISSANCSSGGFGGDFNESGAHDDGSAFLQEQLSLGGVTYYHVIVGDYTKDTMAQEMFIKATGTTYSNSRGSIAPFSASVGNGTSDTNAEFDMTNPYSSNSSLNGNGSGNPTAVILRQVINESGTYQEFLKDSFNNKPKLTEQISDAEIDTEFTVDMRSRTYSDNTPLPISALINTVTLKGSAKFGTEGDAGTSSQLDQYHFTAGEFTYTAAGTNGGGGGTYTYVEPFPNFASPMNIDYSLYCDPSQNTNWSGKGACVNGNGTGGGWGRGGW